MPEGKIAAQDVSIMALGPPEAKGGYLDGK